MQYSQEHLKTMVYAKNGGQTECIMGNWKIENYVRQIFAAVYCNTDLLMPWWLRYFGLVIRMRFSHSLFVLDSGKRALGAIPNTYFYLSVVLVVRLSLKDRKKQHSFNFWTFSDLKRLPLQYSVQNHIKTLHLHIDSTEINKSFVKRHMTLLKLSKLWHFCLILLARVTLNWFSLSCGRCSRSLGGTCTGNGGRSLWGKHLWGWHITACEAPRRTLDCVVKAASTVLFALISLYSEISTILAFVGKNAVAFVT